MKLIMLIIFVVASTAAGAQNNSVTKPAAPTNSVGHPNDSRSPGAPNYINPNYDHTHTYYETPSTNPNFHYLRIEDDAAPVNNNNNNNTMTPYNNTISPYDVTSPYYTPPNANAPANAIPPEH